MIWILERLREFAKPWFVRVRDAHPYHHAIARSMVWVAVFVLVGKLAGAAKEIAIAWRYGANVEVDAYLFLFNLVNWPVSVWFSVLMVVLVPMASRLRQESKDLAQFRAELLGFSVALGAILLLIGSFALPFVLRSHWTGLPADTVALASKMVPAMLLLLPFGILTGLLSAWMLAQRRHANTLLEGVPAFFILIVLLAVPGHGVEPLLWGTVAGFVAHLVSLTVPLATQGQIETPRFTYQSPQWTSFWNGFGLMLIGQALMSFIGVVDQFFASHLGAGAIASLGYANRILGLALGLGAIAVGRATLPVFSKAEAQGDEQVGLVATRWVYLLFALGLLAMLIGWAIAPHAVKLLFERGAFSSDETIVVTEVFRYSLLQLPFYFPALVLVSYASSRNRYGLLLWSGVIGIAVKSVANAMLIPALGIKGVAAAWAPVYAINAYFFWSMLRRTIK